MVSRGWLSLRSWRSQRKDPYWKQAFYPRSNLSLLSLYPCQLLLKRHDSPLPIKWRQQPFESWKIMLQIIHNEERLFYPWEGVDVSCFMTTSQTTLIAFSVSSNVLLVPQLKFSNGLLDNFKPSIISHGLGAETNITNFYYTLSLKRVKKKIHVSLCTDHMLPVVCVSTSSIPVTLAKQGTQQS